MKKVISKEVEITHTKETIITTVTLNVTVDGKEFEAEATKRSNGKLYLKSLIEKPICYASAYLIKGDFTFDIVQDYLDDEYTSIKSN